VVVGGAPVGVDVYVVVSDADEGDGGVAGSELGTQFCLLYWYYSTNTDAEGVALGDLKERMLKCAAAAAAADERGGGGVSVTGGGESLRNKA
jgi:hypothetical protein